MDTRLGFLFAGLLGMTARLFAADGVTCTYDAAGRLVTAYYACTGTAGAVHYYYDAVGNRTRMLAYTPADTARDTDGDGLADIGELRYFGNLTNNAAGDSDADGLVNSNEFLLGGDPLRPDTDGDGAGDREEAIAGTALDDPASYLQVAGILPMAPGQLNVWWEVKSGRTYQLQRCAKLGLAWEDVGAPFAAPTNGTRSIMRTDSSNTFYRVRAWLTP